MRALSVLLGILLLLGGGLWGLLETQKPLWEENTQIILEKLKESPRNYESFEAVSKEAQEILPHFYPFSLLQSALRENATLWQKIESRPNLNFNPSEKFVSKDSLDQFQTWIDEVQGSFKKLASGVLHFPKTFIPASKRSEFEAVSHNIEKLLAFSRDLDTIQESLDNLIQEEENIWILLQNQHEPRSTGGFTGSILILKGTPQGLELELSDIYALDRQINEKAQGTAPEFFWPLSKTISLRDANFWPDFPQSAQEYRRLAQASRLKIPQTIMALDLNIVKAFMPQDQGLSLDPWNLEVSSENFDLFLQFLVESKIAGRFSVKAPLEIFIQKLFQNFSVNDFTSRLPSLLETSKRQKDIQIESLDADVNKLAESWGLRGKLLENNSLQGDFLHFDFISIGANKSERFVWTKLEQSAEVSLEGGVKNTLKIKRTHAAKAGEIEKILGLETFPPNIKNLWNGDLGWKLGYGQNRTILRIWTKKEAKLKTSQTPSGMINISQDPLFPDLQIWEVPLFVSMGESLETTLEFETEIEEGNSKWRPYQLRLRGTAGRDAKTTFTSVIKGKGTLKGAQTFPSLPLGDEFISTDISF